MKRFSHLVIGIFLGVFLAVFAARIRNPKPLEHEAKEIQETSKNQQKQENVAHGTSVEENDAVDSTIEIANSADDTAKSDFQSLMDKVWSGAATPDEQLEFWQKIRESDEFDNVIKAKEQATPLDSDDVAAQMNLANLYVAKLLSVPSGPEQGLWAMKAEQRWHAVLEIDPNHWEAQKSVAFSLSQYPDFLNKTGAAIAEYEKLVSIQESTDPKPQFADTYLSLYRLYEKKGDRGNAVDALQQGLEQFPENEALIEQWNSISTLNIPE